VDVATQTHSQTQQYPAGDSDFESQLPNRKDHHKILLQGRRAFERGDDASALENLSRLTDYGVDYADVHYMAGILLERKGDLDQAVDSLRRAVRLNPAYAEALLALASIHEMRGDFDLSQGYAERASQLTRPVAGQLDPTTRGKLSNQQADLADALAEAGEIREAIQEYRAALDRCPNFHDIRHRLGVHLRDAGLPHQSIQEFQHIIAAHPGMLESRVQLGLTYYSLGQTPEAIQEWRGVIERDASREDAHMYLRLVQTRSESGGGSDVSAGWAKISLDNTENASNLYTSSSSHTPGATTNE